MIPSGITGSVTLHRAEDIHDRLDGAGVHFGSKTSRARLVELLDKYTKAKRPRLSKSISRIPSAKEARTKSHHTESPQAAPVASSSAVSIDTPKDSFPVSYDPVAPEDHDFHIHELSDLIHMLGKVGLDGRGLTKIELVGMCNEYRDLSRYSFEPKYLELT